MDKYERLLVWVAVGYLLFAVLLGGYFYTKWVSACSSDGYLLIRGEVQYQNGKPMRCVRLPL